MAKYRQVHTTFWDDAFVLDLTPEEKYFYLYLMTNDKTTQCGIYELPKRVIEMHTGYNRETVNKLLERFEDYEKITYNEATKEVMLSNWVKYNLINSPKVMQCIDKELKTVKNQGFVQEFIDSCKRYGYRIDTLSIDYGEEEEREREEEEEREEEKEVIPFDEVVSYLNKKTSSTFRHSTKKTKTLIKARWNEGFKLDDFKRVIDIKTSEWINDSKMSNYLRPETLFGTKFESYLNQKGSVQNGKAHAAEQFAQENGLPF
jgi:uncharacterized phage protein (TIGR02220 family)